MSYDFDWDGETLEVGDEEAQTFVLPEEPSGDQVGMDVPGAQAAYSDLFNFGIYNGNFRQGPPDPSSDLTVSVAVLASNFMPGWRFVMSSNTNITARQVRDAASPSGSNLRFTFASGAAGDEAYIEQIVDLGGSRKRWTSDLMRTVFIAGGGNTGTFTVEQRWQYLTVDGSIAGMPSEHASSSAIAAGATVNIIDGRASPPANASRLRVRIVARRGAAANSATGTVDVTDVRRDRGAPWVQIPDWTEPESYDPGRIIQQSGVLRLRPQGDTDKRVGLDGYLQLLEQSSHPTADSGTHAIYAHTDGHAYTADDAGTKRLISGHLVPFTYVLSNVPAGVTTDMQLSDVALALGTPRPVVGWPGSIVGMTYRLSTAITAGGASAMQLEARIGAGNVWTAHTLNTGTAVVGSATQPPGTDTFNAGQAIGVQVITSGGFTPTTLDLAVVLWLLVDYDGA